MNTLTIAIDGPASSGKSTIAKLIAQKLGITYIDTGAMYRGVTLAVLRKGIAVTDEENILALLPQLELKFKLINGIQHLFLGTEDISEVIRSVEVTENVSAVSAIEGVRKQLVSMQQAMAKEQSVVMDGRDIGTVVLKDAPHKFFFVASPLVRAQRRFKENIAKGLTSQTLEEIEQAIIERDYLDSTREHSPLKKADDAIEIDTSEMTIDEVVNRVIVEVENKTNNN
ncbi:(d)CMP kinase [Aerococcaceae bacterium zg-ZUI334]|uniref:(d)CMP kinase n=1 Tax=Aerococcaceae TaxID=186827 RepID=UPI0013B8B86D|nr:MULTISPECIES: (d)CMP kinase [unclassified Facklamia]MBR7927285.1 (d)CMP kinase [Aerococcaceae bacterium zg-ZUI334]NEW63663.1 (d)CMP kinase [Facklamia sp. 252]NEW67134.1 (d)CMP kinase [Facklamia sp. 253]QQD66323.1 (d)CMP kinase [Aerococcaceae bacterium zg-252]